MSESKFLRTWTSNTEYFNLLSLMARLSNLFSDNRIPFLHYRVTEKLFCKYFDAEDLSRSDTAYDAKTEKLGIGIKTFQIPNESSFEKVAEFNSISRSLKRYQGKDLAYNLALARNERIELGKRLYSIDSGCYHVIGRVQDGLTVFNNPYPLINKNNITNVKDTGRSLAFFDGESEYNFNYSKSTLFKKFHVPKEKVEVPVSIIQDPYELLRELIDTEPYEGKFDDAYNVHEIIKKQYEAKPTSNLKLGESYVVLPLFATSKKERQVPQKSGLNQWNASGRARNPNEVYIPIPSKVNLNYPNFFPSRDVKFTLKLPNGSSMSAKVCQDNRKALMTDPNKDLGKWILRDVLQLEEGELVTMDLLDKLGFDSVIIYKESSSNYKIDVIRTISYSDEMFYEVDRYDEIKL